MSWVPTVPQQGVQLSGSESSLLARERSLSQARQSASGGTEGGEQTEQPPPSPAGSRRVLVSTGRPSIPISASTPATAGGSSGVQNRRRLHTPGGAPAAKSVASRVRAIPTVPQLTDEQKQKREIERKSRHILGALLGATTGAKYVLGTTYGPKAWIGFEVWGGRVQPRPSFIIQQLRNPAEQGTDDATASHFASEVLAQLHILSEERLGLFNILPVKEYAHSIPSAAAAAAAATAAATTTNKPVERYLVLPHFQCNLKLVWEAKATSRYTTMWEGFFQRKLIQILTALRFLHAHQYVHGTVDMVHVLTEENGNTCALMPSDLTHAVAVPPSAFTGSSSSLSSPTSLLSGSLLSSSSSSPSHSASRFSMGSKFEQLRPQLRPPEAHELEVSLPLHSLDVWQLGMMCADMLSVKLNFSEDVYRELMAHDPANPCLRELFEDLDPGMTGYPKWPLIADLVSSMLRFKPGDRESAFDLLSHPFFHDYLLLNLDLFHLVHAPLILKLLLAQREKIFLFRQRAATISSVRNKRDSRAHELASSLAQILAKNVLPSFPERVPPAKQWALILQLAHTTLPAFLQAHSGPPTLNLRNTLRRTAGPLSPRATVTSAAATSAAGGGNESQSGCGEGRSAGTATMQMYGTDDCLWKMLAAGNLEGFTRRMESEGAMLCYAGESGGIVVLSPSQIPLGSSFITQCIHEHSLRAIGPGLYSLDGIEVSTTARRHPDDHSTASSTVESELFDLETPSVDDEDSEDPADATSHRFPLKVRLSNSVTQLPELPDPPVLIPPPPASGKHEIDAESEREKQRQKQKQEEEEEQERQRRTELERQQLAEAGQALETEKKKLASQLERLAELERQRLEELERQREAEQERVRSAEEERQRLAALEQERSRELEQQRAVELERQRSLEELEVARQQERREREEIERQREAAQVEKERLQAEMERLRHEVEVERERQAAAERARQAEVEEEQRLEKERARQAKAEKKRLKRQHTQELLEKQKLQEELERQQVEQQRLKEELERQREREKQRLAQEQEHQRQQEELERQQRQQDEERMHHEQSQLEAQLALLERLQRDQESERSRNAQRLAELQQEIERQQRQLEEEEREKERAQAAEAERQRELAQQRLQEEQELQRLQAELERQKEVERARLEELERQRQAEEQRKAHAAELERQQREAEQERQRREAELERQRKAAEQREQELEQQRQRAAQARREKEAELERQRQEAEQERQRLEQLERQQREAELERQRREAEQERQRQKEQEQRKEQERQEQERQQRQKEAEQEQQRRQKEQEEKEKVEQEQEQERQREAFEAQLRQENDANASRQDSRKRRELIRSLHRELSDFEEEVLDLHTNWRRMQRHHRHALEERSMFSLSLPPAAAATGQSPVSLLSSSAVKAFLDTFYFDVSRIANEALALLCTELYQVLEKLRAKVFPADEHSNPVPMADAMEIWQTCIAVRDVIESSIDGIVSPALLDDATRKIEAAASKFRVPCALPAQPNIVALFDSADDVLAGFLEQNTWMLQFSQTSSADASAAPPSAAAAAAAVPQHFVSPRSALSKLKPVADKPGLSSGEYYGARCTVLSGSSEPDCRALGLLLSQLVSNHLVAMICSDFSSYIALQYHPDSLADRFGSGAPPSWEQARALFLDLSIGMHFLHSRSVAHGHLDRQHVWFEPEQATCRVALTRPAPAFSMRAVEQDIQAYYGIVKWLAARLPSSAGNAELDEFTALFESRSVRSFEQIVGHFRARGLLVNRLQQARIEKEELMEKSEALERTLIIRKRLLVPLENELKELRAAFDAAQREPPSPARSGATGDDGGAADAAQVSDEVAALEKELELLNTELREMPRNQRAQQSAEREKHRSRIEDLEAEFEEVQRQVSAVRKEITTLRKNL